MSNLLEHIKRRARVIVCSSELRVVLHSSGESNKYFDNINGFVETVETRFLCTGGLVNMTGRGVRLGAGLAKGDLQNTLHSYASDARPEALHSYASDALPEALHSYASGIAPDFMVLVS